MSAASVSFAIGTAAASNITDGASTRANPGSAVTIALQSSTGIRRWILREDGTDYLKDKGFMYQADLGGVFSCSLTLPMSQCTIPLVSSTWDGNNEVRARVTLLCYANAIGVYHRAAAVNTSNVNTASMNVVIDGQTLTQGEYVLLVAQTTGAECGLYTIGSVAANLAALTRAPDMPSGFVLPSPQIVEVEKGTLYGGTTWKTSNTGSLTVGTTSMTFYPRIIRGQVATASGTKNINSQFIQSGATAYASCNSTTNAVQAAVPVAGAGTGYCVFSSGGGSSTDQIQYSIVNWG